MEEQGTNKDELVRVVSPSVFMPDPTLADAMFAAALLMRYAKISGAGIMQLGGLTKKGKASGNRVVVAIGTENSRPLKKFAETLEKKCA